MNLQTWSPSENTINKCVQEAPKTDRRLRVYRGLVFKMSRKWCSWLRMIPAARL